MRLARDLFVEATRRLASRKLGRLGPIEDLLDSRRCDGHFAARDSLHLLGDDRTRGRGEFAVRRLDDELDVRLSGRFEHLGDLHNARPRRVPRDIHGQGKRLLVPQLLCQLSLGSEIRSQLRHHFGARRAEEHAIKLNLVGGHLHLRPRLEPCWWKRSLRQELFAVRSHLSCELALSNNALQPASEFPHPRLACVGTRVRDGERRTCNMVTRPDGNHLRVRAGGHLTGRRGIAGGLNDAAGQGG